jgi:hypothetical protein
VTEGGVIKSENVCVCLPKALAVLICNDSSNRKKIISMASNQQAQQISLTDLDISQLTDVRRQLDEVSSRARI